MQVTVTLTDREMVFLQNIQKMMNMKKTPLENQTTLEDIIHECITTVISLGINMQKGQA